MGEDDRSSWALTNEFKEVWYWDLKKRLEGMDTVNLDVKNEYPYGNYTNQRNLEDSDGQVNS